jgi:hypothetical protein
MTTQEIINLVLILQAIISQVLHFLQARTNLLQLKTNIHLENGFFKAMYLEKVDTSKTKSQDAGGGSFAG